MTIIPKRVNYCEPVRNALERRGISVVKIVEAANAVIGQMSLKQDSYDETTGGMRVSKTAQIKVTASAQFVSEDVNIVHSFDEWAMLVYKCWKKAPFDLISLPEKFNFWLKKFEPEHEPEYEPLSESEQKTNP